MIVLRREWKGRDIGMDQKTKLSLNNMPYSGYSDEIQYPHGIKWTRQRKSVYKVLWEAEEPLSAIQIYNRLATQGDGCGYAVSTIYRILAAFEENGLTEKTTWMGDGTVVYNLNRGKHTHYAVCLKCHNRIPLPGCPFAHIHPGQGMDGFTVTGHKLELYGYCKECSQSNPAF